MAFPLPPVDDPLSAPGEAWLVVPVWFNELLIVVVMLFAWAKGGTAERVVATTIFASVELYRLAQTTMDGSTTQYARALAVEGAQTAIMVAVALRSTRYWTVAEAALSLLSVATVVAQTLIVVDLWAYGTIQRVWGYLGMAAVAYGTWQTWQARKMAACSCS